MPELYLASAVRAYDRAIDAMQQYDLTSAIAHVEEALRRQPNYFEAKKLLADIYFLQQDHARAMSLLDELHAQNPNDVDVLMQIGVLHYSNGDTTSAHRCLSQVFQSDEPISLPKLSALAMILLEQGDTETLKTIVARLNAQTSTTPEVYPILANLYLALGDNAAASAASDQWLQIARDDIEGIQFRISLALQQNDFPTAMRYLQQGLALAPELPTLLAMLALVHVHTGDTQQAVAVAAQAIALEEQLEEPSVPAVYVLCAEVYTTLGDFPRAIELLTKHIDEDDSDEVAMRFLIALAKQSNDLDPLEWLANEVLNEDDVELQEEIAVAIQIIRARTDPARARKRKAINPPKHAYQLRVELRNIRPPIWRTLLVSGAMTLSGLHQAIQAAMHWDDAHLHQFYIDGTYYGIPEYGDWMTLQDDSRYILDALQLREKAKFDYTYDFGDNWDMIITVQKVLPYDADVTYPQCLKGKRAAPPEDCGGVWGYLDRLEAMNEGRDADDEEYCDEEFEEIIDPEAFDLDAINARMRRLQFKRR